MTKYRGFILIFLMFGTAAGIAGFAVWFNQRQSYRVIEALSPRVTQLIAYAPQVEIRQLVPTNEPTAGEQETSPTNDQKAHPAGDGEIMNIQGHSYKTAAQKNPSDLDRFKEVRHWLLHNDNYDWNAQAQDDANHWDYLISFSDEANQAQLAFDMQHQCLLLVPDGKPVSFAPMHEGLKTFFEDQFSPPQNAPAKEN
jgi:hypothetical protein